MPKLPLLWIFPASKAPGAMHTMAKRAVSFIISSVVLKVFKHHHAEVEGLPADAVTVGKIAKPQVIFNVVQLELPEIPFEEFTGYQQFQRKFIGFALTPVRRAGLPLRRGTRPQAEVPI